MNNQRFDREKLHLNIARIKKGGKLFEIDIDPNLAFSYKEGKDVEMHDILKAPHIFSDLRKGMLASEHEMKKLFGTDDTLEVAKFIIDHGELPMTAEYKEKMRELKKKQIIALIHKNAVDAQTHIPHPVDRIERAMAEAKVKIDEFKSVQAQLQDVIKQLRAILPIKFEVKEIAVKIPPAYAAKSYGVVTQFGKIIKDEWEEDGSWVLVVEMPAGLETDFYEKINALCHGEVESKVTGIR
jgi:ribosome maturation protein SDO1